MCSCPQNGWDKVKEECKIPPLFSETERIAIPIDRLCHVTHSNQAKVIQPHEGQTSYTFKPNPKYGKDAPEETTQKIKNTFQKVEHYERVMRGNLSWWGVDTHSWYNSDGPGQVFHSAVGNLHSKRVFVTPFMSIARESRYGDNGFVVNFRGLLTFYKESRNDIAKIEDRALFLLVGGTLKYRYEICYVVIVCTKHDKLQECYPSLYDCSDIFNHKGLLDPSGEIKTTFFESAETIDFKIKHPIKCAPTRQYSCYEIPAFAFYYPETSPTLSLQCPQTSVEEVQMSHECENYHKCRKNAHI